MSEKYIPPHRRTSAINWKAVRSKLWDSLKIDDANGLMATLSSLPCALEEAFAILEEKIWNEANTTKFGRGLAVIAASNINGVPENGAIKCLKTLLDTGLISREQKDRALDRLRWIEPKRSDAIELLESSIFL